MRNTTWQQIQPGQIVRFVYKSQGTSKGEQRTILVIDPKHRYRKKSTGRVVEFVVGLQLDTLLSPPIDIRNFNKLISRYGGLTLDEGVVEVGSNPDRADKNTAEDIYKLLERFLKKMTNWLSKTQISGTLPGSFDSGTFSTDKVYVVQYYNVVWGDSSTYCSGIP